MFLDNKFKELLDENKDLFIDRLKELLRINSIYDETTKSKTMPFGKGVEEALQYFINMANIDGFETVKDGGYAGHIDYGMGDKLIGILCHLDVVPVGDDWDNDPFDPVVKDGKIIARGAMDDKGPTMAVYCALKIIKDLNIPIKNKIRIILGTDEETNWRGINHYFKNYPMPEIGFAPDANFPLIYGEKGLIHGLIKSSPLSTDVISITGGSRFNIVIDKCNSVTLKDHSIEFYKYLTENHLEGSFKEINSQYHYQIIGLAAHAMEPFKGINAGTHMCKFLSKYTDNPLVNFVSSKLHQDNYLKNLHLDMKTDEMGPLTFNIGIIDINQNDAKIGIDIRYPMGYDYDNFMVEMTKIATNNDLKLVDFSSKVPHYVDKCDPLVEGLYNIYVKHTNDTLNKPITIGGGTYARALKKAVAFGMEMPNDETVAHQKNEYIKISAYLQAILIYIDAILYLGNL